MRNFVFALILLNLGVAAWYSWFSPLGRPTRPMDSGMPGIELSEELAQDTGLGAGGDDSAADPGSSAGEMDISVERCSAIGPFSDLGQTVDAGAKLSTAGYDPVQRVDEGDIWVGYWVYIDGIETREAANAAVAELRELGVSDAYSIPAESGGNIVSLGVFSELARASNRLEQARQWGFESAIAERSRRGTVYWVEIVLAPNETLDFNLLYTPGQIVRLEQRACEAG